MSVVGFGLEKRQLKFQITCEFFTPGAWCQDVVFGAALLLGSEGGSAFLRKIPNLTVNSAVA